MEGGGVGGVYVCLPTPHLEISFCSVWKEICWFDLIWFYLTLSCVEIFYPINFLIYLKVKVTQLLNSNSPIIISRAPWQGILRIPESAKFLRVSECECECWALASGIQLKESWIPLTIEAQNPSSTEKESGIQFLKSNPRRGSRIQVRLRFPYMGWYGARLHLRYCYLSVGQWRGGWGGGGATHVHFWYHSVKTPKKFSTIRKRFTFCSGKRIWRDRCPAANVFRFATRSGKSCQDPNLEDTCFKGLM